MGRSGWSSTARPTPGSRRKPCWSIARSRVEHGAGQMPWFGVEARASEKRWASAFGRRDCRGRRRMLPRISRRLAMPHDRLARITRRRMVQGAALGLGAGTLPGARAAAASTESKLEALIARPPANFTPLTIPGKVTKVSAKGDVSACMQKNQLWPLPDVARRLLEKAMMDFTGAANLKEAMGRFIHPDDVVGIKVNGIAGQTGHTMAVNF